MGTQEIIKEIKKLPYTERLVIVEQTMKIISEENKDTLEKAADLMQSEYNTNKDLTAFNSIDFDDFYETK